MVHHRQSLSLGVKAGDYLLGLVFLESYGLENRLYWPVRDSMAFYPTKNEKILAWTAITG